MSTHPGRDYVHTSWSALVYFYRQWTAGRRNQIIGQQNRAIRARTK